MSWPGFHSVDFHPHGLDEWANQPGGQALGGASGVCIRPYLFMCLGCDTELRRITTP